MRLDKFLKVSRILKRRTVANEACSGGRVSVNNKPSKPSCRLNIGDRVEISFGDKKLAFKILSLNEHAKKEEAEAMYEVIDE